MATKKLMHDTYNRCEPMRKAFSDMDARCMEVTEEKKYGILWERWVLPNGKSAVLWATPFGWDVFLPAGDTNSTEATIALVRSAAQQTRSRQPSTS